MSRLRKPNGEVLEDAQDYGFVELCDVKGNPAFVLYKDGPMYKLVSASDVEARRYEKLFGVQFVQQKALPL